MHIKIRKAIKLAEQGATRKQLMEYFGVDERTYKKEFASFSPANRRTLRSLLISNGKSKKIPLDSSKKIIWDTSYILSKHCDFYDITPQVVILPEVYEQLVIQEKNGNPKICLLFHLILDNTVTPTFIKESHIPKFVPDYEDSADLEIVEFAKLNPNCEVFTCDKGLAIRCFQQGIKYSFFDIRHTA